jgi:hypothetical protein
VAAPVLVLVEGPDDQEVCRHLVSPGEFDTFEFKSAGGYRRLLNSIRKGLKQSDLEALAIVVDADDDLKRRWAELSDKIRKSGYQRCPDQPSPLGTIVTEGGKPLIGIWIMPDNSTSGSLEHFAADLISKSDPLWPRAQRTVDDIPLEHRPFTETTLPKVKIHTWLAWQEEPGTKMGGAIRRKYFDSRSERAELFVSWLRG